MDSQFEKIPLGQIRPDPTQPRKTFRPESLEELAGSIRVKGQITPVRVRRDPAGGFILVAGERRWRACQLLQAAGGRETIDAMVAQDDEPLSRLEVQLAENLMREDMPVLEEAAALQRFLEAGYSAAAVGRAIGRRVDGEQYVRWRISLLSLIPICREALAMGALTPVQATMIAKLAQPGNQHAAFVALRDRVVKKDEELNLLVTTLRQAEEQGTMFEVKAVPKADRERVAKFDRMLDQLERFVKASVGEEDAAVLREVLDGNVAVRMDRLELIIKQLSTIRLALKNAKARQQAIEVTQKAG